MRAAVAFRALGPIDARAIRRDAILGWLVVMPLALGVVVRFGLPVLENALHSELDFDLAPYRDLLIGFLFVMLAPMLVGFVTGFLLLDERDDNTLTALLATPLSLDSYLAYRIGAPLLVCTAMSLTAIAISGAVTISWPLLIAIQLLAAVEAPIVALILASIAENKVQGFALTKALQVVLQLPILAWFVGMPLQLVAGIIPTYWPMRAYWSAADPGPAFWIYLAVGFAWHIALLGWLLRRFDRIMRR